MSIPQHMVAHLQHCTVAVYGSDGFTGSGVWVMPSVVLTCAHVVHAAQAPCQVSWQGQYYALDHDPDLFPPPSGRWDDSYPFPDLAVRRIRNPPAHPSAQLAMEDPPIGAQVYAAGFSTQTLSGGTAPDGVYSGWPRIAASSCV